MHLIEAHPYSMHLIEAHPDSMHLIEMFNDLETCNDLARRGREKCVP